MHINYNMNQLYLPTDHEAEIPANHVVQVVNEAVDLLSDAIFDSAYPGGGRPSYHPKMLTKVIIYAYTQRTYSSHQVAKTLRENITFMWLAARQTPDFRTINRFRSERIPLPLALHLLNAPVQSHVRRPLGCVSEVGSPGAGNVGRISPRFSRDTGTLSLHLGLE